MRIPLKIYIVDYQHDDILGIDNISEIYVFWGAVI